MNYPWTSAEYPWAFLKLFMSDARGGAVMSNVVFPELPLHAPTHDKCRAPEPKIPFKVHTRRQDHCCVLAPIELRTWVDILVPQAGSFCRFGLYCRWWHVHGEALDMDATGFLNLLVHEVSAGPIVLFTKHLLVGSSQSIRLGSHHDVDLQGS